MRLKFARFYAFFVWGWGEPPAQKCRYGTKKSLHNMQFYGGGCAPKIRSILCIFCGLSLKVLKVFKGFNTLSGAPAPATLDDRR